MGFQQGVSGLSAAAKALDVTGNNIANSGTVGFKASRTNFADVYAASMLMGGAGSAGLGTSVSNVQQLFTQGNKTTTSNALDLAISGGGFYKLGKITDSYGNLSGAETFTRNGQFHLNGDGFIVNDQNLALVGVQASSLGVVPTTIKDTDLGPINVTNSVGNPKATTAATIKGNLNSSTTPSTTAFDITDTATFTNANFSRGMDVYDSEGYSHSFDYYFVKTATTNQWQVYGTLSDVYNDSSSSANAPAGGSPGTNLAYLDANGVSHEDFLRPNTTNANITDPNNCLTVQFDTNGVLQWISGDAGTTQYTYNPSKIPADFSYNGSNFSVEAVSQLFKFTFDDTSLGSGGVVPEGTVGTKVSPLGVAMDLSNLTQFASASTVDKLTQDGYPKGRLTGLNVDETGLIQAQYDNGKTSNVGRVVLYSFTNPNALQNLGNNQWGETASAGKSYSYAGEGNLGTIQSYATEDSNVDLTQELVNLITEQRNYQANAQTIKTQDQVLQTLVNLR